MSDRKEMSILVEEHCFGEALGSGRAIDFFFNDTATTEIYTLSLHDALPISIQDANFRFQVFVS